MLKFAATILKSASLWTIISVALRVGSGLLTLPLALRVLSSSELGLYYTFLGLTSLVLLLDFGFAQTVSRSASFAMGGAKEFKSSGVSESCAAGGPNWTLLAELLGAVQIWYRGAGVVLALLMLVPGSMFLIPMIREAGLSPQYIGCWWLYAGVSAYSFVTTYWPDLLFGIGSVRSAARIGIISQLTGVSLLFAGLIAGWGLWSYGISSLVGAAIGRVLTKKAFAIDASQALITQVDRTKRNLVLSRLWPMAWRQGVVMLGAYLIQRGNTLICSAKLGLEETGRYGLSLNILNLIFQVAIIPLMLVWPIIGRLRVDRNYSKIRHIFNLRLYGGLTVAFLAIIILSIWGNTILQLLGANTGLLSTPIFFLLGLILWLECHHSQYASLVLTENNNPFIWPAIFSGIAIFCFSWWASGIWGVMGMLIAQGGVQLCWNNWWTVVRAIKGLRPT